MIEDKPKVSSELLSLAGFLCDHMIKTMENKTEELALLAQTPPTLLQWINKQVLLRYTPLIECMLLMYNVRL